MFLCDGNNYIKRIKYKRMNKFDQLVNEEEFNRFEVR